VCVLAARGLALVERIPRSRKTVLDEISALLSRLHVLVIGPGLGREKYMQDYARDALSIAKERGMFLVLDADGLFMVGQDLSLIKGYRRAVLTPNVVEFKRLSEQAVSVASSSLGRTIEDAVSLPVIPRRTRFSSRGRVSTKRHHQKTSRRRSRMRSAA
jgi:NAD(P)H-hydrate repair Nnr-like enzyme with NAD(P)H-hydrate dehydratase domain